MNAIKYLIAVVTLCVFMTSCDGYVIYNNIVINKSLQDIYLTLYANDDDNCRHNRGFYYSKNGFCYPVTYIGKEDTEINCPLEWLRLEPGESIKFTSDDTALFVSEKYPEFRNTDAIWLNQNCIKKILIGDNLDQSGDTPVCNEQLAPEYWSKSSNWIIQNKKSDYIEFCLVIDDEVIREHSVPAD